MLKRFLLVLIGFVFCFVNIFFVFDIAKLPKKYHEKVKKLQFRK